MSLQIEMLENGHQKLTIEVPAEEYEAAMNRGYIAVAKQVTMPGYRRGKAPRVLVEKYYHNQIVQQAIPPLIQTAYEKTIAEAELKVLDEDNVSIVQMESGKPFIFTVEVELGEADEAQEPQAEQENQ